MWPFIKTSLFITIICVTVKMFVVTGTAYVKENHEEIGELAKVLEPENMDAAKNFIQSASSKIEVNGQEIEIDTDDPEAFRELYALAENEADKMVATGDTAVLEEQMEKNKPFLDWLFSRGEN
jgi:hypothetical protein